MFKHKIYESTNHFDGIELVGRDFHFNCSSEASACFNYEMIQATMWGTIEYEDDAITATSEFMQILKMLSHKEIRKICFINFPPFSIWKRLPATHSSRLDLKDNRISRWKWNWLKIHKSIKLRNIFPLAVSMRARIILFHRCEAGRWLRNY